MEDGVTTDMAHIRGREVIKKIASSRNIVVHLVWSNDWCSTLFCNRAKMRVGDLICMGEDVVTSSLQIVEFATHSLQDLLHDQFVRVWKC